IVRTRPTAFWIEHLNAAGVPAGPVYTVDKVFEDPQVKHLRLARAVDHPTLGTLDLVGQPVKFSDCDAGPRTAAPEIGEHTDEILHELGYDTAEIATLKTNNIIATGRKP